MRELPFSASRNLAYADNDGHYTYADLAAAAELVACRLAAQGMQPRDIVALSPATDWSTLQLFWAIFRIGALACPVNTRFPRQQQLALAERVGAKVLLWRDDVAQLTAPSSSGDRPSINSSDVSSAGTVLFSSGSTGEPKAIVHNLSAHIWSARGAAAVLPLRANDRWLWSLPAFHVSGLSIMIRCAISEATVVPLLRQADLAQQIEQHHITHLSLVTTQLYRILDSSPSHWRSLRGILLGGSAIPRELLRRGVAHGLPIHTTYGLTETASQVATSPRHKEDSVDRPSARVLPEREVSISHDGEILVRGPILCRGYLRDGVIKRVTDEHGWFHTGDIGELDSNGCLRVTGRRDNMFISGGENIHPEEIERALLNLDGIQRAIVLPVPDDVFGHRPLAFVDGDRIGDWNALRKALTRTLADYQIPVAFRRWPSEADAGIKPNRAAMAQLVHSPATWRDEGS